MRDRQVLETVLMRRFPGAAREQVAAAANAIMALLDQWRAEERQRPVPAGEAGILEGERHERTHRH